ncbi:MAG: DUF362 domain-containing protein [Candidatus Lokiarchaeota archaeon]|nr:DUF362 domain-containing protein [Candidatus Lokiarchaeota archaeon]
MIKIEKVVIVNSKNLKEKIKYCLETVEFNPSSNEFVLKPNIVSRVKSGSGHITDLRIVESLIELLNEEYDAEKIIIPEGPTLLLKNPMELFDYVGYTKLVKKFPNVSLVDIYQADFTNKGLNFAVPELLEGRSLINLPVLKGHAQAGLTCAIKNLKGLLRQTDKKKFHSDGLDKNLATLVDLKPELTLVDAIKSVESEGDLLTKKYKFNLLICGKNPVIVDEVCSKLIGLGIEEIPYLKTLIEKEPLKYEVIGEARELAQFKPFRHMFKYGKIDVYFNDCCSYCVGVLIDLLLPPRYKKHRKLGVIVRLLGSYFKKQKTSYIMGRNMKFKDEIEGNVLLVGNCAKNLYPGTLIPGCPPSI